MAFPEYKLKFSDHVQKLLRNGGLLTPSAAAAVYQARASEIDRAIVGESARWGDNRVYHRSIHASGLGNDYQRRAG